MVETVGCAKLWAGECVASETSEQLEARRPRREMIGRSNWVEREEIAAMAVNSGKAWTVQEDEQQRELAALIVRGVRVVSDDTPVSFQDFGFRSPAYLRETLGVPSTDGVRIAEKTAASR